MDKFEGEWLKEHTVSTYTQSCIEAISDLSSFKTIPGYAAIVGNDLRNRQTASSFFTFIKKNFPEIYKDLQSFTINDNIGNPNIFNIEGINISPGTLRYVRVLGDILTFDPKSIVEIGGGYGGQALVTHIHSPSIEYTLIDYTEPLALAKKYLDTVAPSKNYNFIDSNNIYIPEETTYDLVVSDYCLSEFDKSGIEFYFNSVLSKSKNGYFSINSTAERRKVLLDKLKETFDEVIIESESPKTTHHPNILAKCYNNINL